MLDCGADTHMFGKTLRALQKNPRHLTVFASVSLSTARRHVTLVLVDVELEVRIDASTWKKITIRGIRDGCPQDLIIGTRGKLRPVVYHIDPRMPDAEATPLDVYHEEEETASWASFRFAPAPRTRTWEALAAFFGVPASSPEETAYAIHVLYGCYAATVLAHTCSAYGFPVGEEPFQAACERCVLVHPNRVVSPVLRNATTRCLPLDPKIGETAVQALRLSAGREDRLYVDTAFASYVMDPARDLFIWNASTVARKDWKHGGIKLIDGLPVSHIDLPIMVRYPSGLRVTGVTGDKSGESFCEVLRPFLTTMISGVSKVIGDGGGENTAVSDNAILLQLSTTPITVDKENYLGKGPIEAHCKTVKRGVEWGVRAITDFLRFYRSIGAAVPMDDALNDLIVRWGLEVSNYVHNVTAHTSTNRVPWSLMFRTPPPLKFAPLTIWGVNDNKGGHFPFLILSCCFDNPHKVAGLLLSWDHNVRNLKLGREERDVNTLTVHPHRWWRCSSASSLKLDQLQAAYEVVSKVVESQHKAAMEDQETIQKLKQPQDQLPQVTLHTLTTNLTTLHSLATNYNSRTPLDAGMALDLIATLYTRRHQGVLPPHLLAAPLRSIDSYSPDPWTTTSKLALTRSLMEEAHDAAENHEQEIFANTSLTLHALKTIRVASADDIDPALRKEARVAELTKRFKMGIVSRAPPQAPPDSPFGKFLASAPAPHYLPLPLVFVDKVKDPGPPPILGSRVCVDGSRVPKIASSSPPLFEFISELETTMDLPSACDRRLTLSLMARMLQTPATTLQYQDINAAFYRTPYLGPYSIKVPSWMPTGEYRSAIPSEGNISVGPGDIVYPHVVVPGIAEGPSVFTATFAREMGNRGYEQLFPGLFAKGTRPPPMTPPLSRPPPLLVTPLDPEAIVSAFVDDIATCGSVENNKAAYTQINQFTKLDEPVTHDRGATVLYVGWDIKRVGDGLEVTAKSFLDSVITKLPPGTKMSYYTELNVLATQFAKHETVTVPFTVGEKHDAEEWVGYLGWAATITFECLIAHQLLSRLISRDPVRATRLSQSMLLAAHRRHTPLLFTPLPLHVSVLVYTDASYYKESCGYYGLVIKLVPTPPSGDPKDIEIVDKSDRTNIMYWRSHRYGTDFYATGATASYSGELEALIFGMQQALLCLPSIQAIHYVDNLMIFTDNESLKNAMTSGNTNDPFKIPRLNLAMQMKHLMNGLLFHVSGELHMLADFATKPWLLSKTAQEIEELELLKKRKAAVA